VRPVRGATPVFGLVLAALMAASVGLQVARDRRFPQRQQLDRYLYVRSDTALRRLTLAFQALVLHMVARRLTAGEGVALATGSISQILGWLDRHGTV